MKQNLAAEKSLRVSEIWMRRMPKGAHRLKSGASLYSSTVSPPIKSESNLRQLKFRSECSISVIIISLEGAKSLGDQNQWYCRYPDGSNFLAWQVSSPKISTAFEILLIYTRRVKI